jgi:hypothetical protein
MIVLPPLFRDTSAQTQIDRHIARRQSGRRPGTITGTTGIWMSGRLWSSTKKSSRSRLASFTWGFLRLCSPTN